MWIERNSIYESYTTHVNRNRLIQRVVLIPCVNEKGFEGQFFMNINNVIYEKLHKKNIFDNKETYDNDKDTYHYYNNINWSDGYYFPTESEIHDYMSEYPCRVIDDIPERQGKIYTLSGLKMRGMCSSEIFHFGGYVMRSDFNLPPVMK